MQDHFLKTNPFGPKSFSIEPNAEDFENEQMNPF